MTAKNKRASNHPAPSPDLRRHSRRCVVCHHPQRNQIDFDFVHWRHPVDIVRKYNIRHRSLLYRHARATGLYAARSCDLRGALDHILDGRAPTPLNLEASVRAVHAYSHLSDPGKWFEPTRKLAIAKDNRRDPPLHVLLRDYASAAIRSEAAAIHEPEGQNPAPGENQICLE
jgi:hypothetical protein